GPPMWPRSPIEPAAATLGFAGGTSTLKIEHKEKIVEEQAPPPSAAAAAPAVDARIGIEDFLKVELKVAKVREAVAMPKSKKLIRLLVDVGEAEPRTILAGIAEGYQPEQLVGKTIVIVANLKPRPMMGTESHGMVLAHPR